MKTSSCLLLVLLGLIFPLNTQGEGQALGSRKLRDKGYVLIYLEENFAGRAYRVPIPSALGEHAQLELAGIPNDSIQSLRIPEGVSVTLYDYRSFGGEHRSYTGNVASLGLMKMLTSSLRVVRDPDAARAEPEPAFATPLAQARRERTYVQVFLEENFRGRPYSVEVPAAMGNGAQLNLVGIPDNSIRSLRIPDGVVVTLYEHSAFGGAHRTYTGKVSSIGALIDRVSGLRAEFRESAVTQR